MRAPRVVVALLTLALLAWAGPAWAWARLECPAEVGQGLPFFVRVVADEAPGAVDLEFGSVRARVEPREGGGGWEALALLGTNLEAAPGPVRLVARLAGSGGPLVLEREVRVVDRSFPEQRLSVAREMVHLTPEARERHEAERAEVRRVLADVSRPRAWGEAFVRPVPGAVSSAFGLRRFFNGEPRAPHRGVDLRGPEGQPVLAMAPGTVVLAAQHYFAGGSVYVDHGQGLVSMYFHLSELLVRPGDILAAGDVLGRVGSTGRVTGPHLHFGLAVYGELVDPMPLVTGSLRPE